MGPRRPIALLSLSLILGGCSAEPVDWSNVSYRPSQLGDPDTRSAIISANLPDVPGTAAPCIQSVRSAAVGPEMVRAWWSARADRSVVLSFQRSNDQGKSWESPLEVEARDRGSRGCNRPAPGIFYDAVHGYIHLVYFIEGGDGAGVFFCHSMDNGGMFHSPVPIVYGSAPAAAAVAGHGDSVVVVYEDPNSTQSRIGIALSHVTGHIFDQHTEVTAGEPPAIAPWAALRGDTITVWWKVPAEAGSRSGDRVGYRGGVWR